MIVDRRLWIVDCGLWIVDRGLWIVDRGPWTVDRGLWTVDRAARVTKTRPGCLYGGAARVAQFSREIVLHSIANLFRTPQTT